MTSAADIALRLGLRKHPRSWRGRCPVCGYRGDTFVVSSGPDGQPRFFCANGCARLDIGRALQCVFAGNWAPVERDDESEAEATDRKRQAALDGWSGASPALGTPAELYLRNRGIGRIAMSAALRFRADVPHPEGGRRMAMLALVKAADDRPVAVHRTFITADGHDQSQPSCPRGPDGRGGCLVWLGGGRSWEKRLQCAASDKALKTIRQTVRSWTLHERSDKSLNDLARMFNSHIRGWINYYGRYYKSALYPTLRHIDLILARWAHRKFKSLRRHQRRSRHWLARIARRQPRLFAHWCLLHGRGWTMGAG